MRGKGNGGCEILTGSWQGLNFQRGAAVKEGGEGGGGGCNFYMKSKGKSEIFNDKKSFINQNVFYRSVRHWIIGRIKQVV